MSHLAASTLQVKDHYWIDPGAIGTLAHLVRGPMPTRGVYHEARAVCARTIAGEPLRSCPDERACAQCVDVATRAPGT